MSAVPPVIANPILNSPFREPTRHFRFNDQGINHGGFGRWAFVEVTDPWGNAKRTIRAAAAGALHPVGRAVP